MKERKELACGDSAAEAQDAFRDHYGKQMGPEHEIVLDLKTNLWQVLRKRVPRDRTVKRAIRREGVEPYGYGKDKRPVVLIIHPRELLEVRLKGRRKGHIITWIGLYAFLVRRDALAEIHFKKQERKQKRLAAKAARKQRGKR